ncbi:2713_t:CDS:1, partial [Cetraspora pellucida]
KINTRSTFEYIIAGVTEQAVFNLFKTKKNVALVSSFRSATATIKLLKLLSIAVTINNIISN